MACEVQGFGSWAYLECKAFGAFVFGFNYLEFEYAMYCLSCCLVSSIC